MESWFGFFEYGAHQPTSPKSPASPSSPSSSNYSDYGLAAVFALAVLWGLMGPRHKTSKEVRKHVSRKRH